METSPKTKLEKLKWMEELSRRTEANNALTGAAKQRLIQRRARSRRKAKARGQKAA